MALGEYFRGGFEGALERVEVHEAFGKGRVLALFVEVLQKVSRKGLVYLKELSAGLSLVVGLALVALLVLFSLGAFLLLAVPGGVQAHDVGLDPLEVVILQ